MVAASTAEHRQQNQPRPWSDADTCADSAFARSGLVRMLGTGEMLFRCGDPKQHVYRVIQGLLGSIASGSQSRGIVAFCISGEILGLGALERHTLTVEAIGPSVVQCLPRAALDAILAQDEQLAARHAETTDTELGLLRDALVAQGRTDAVVRVAALLSVLSATNGYEGRRRDVIDDDITCGFVTERLGLDVGALEAALIELSRMRLIRALPAGALRILDIAGLDLLASCNRAGVNAPTSDGMDKLQRL